MARKYKKMSIAKTGENHPLYGKHHSEETKRKISEAQQGRERPQFSAKWKQNMSKSHKGQIPWNKGKKLPPFSNEHKRKIGDAQKGKKGNNWKGGIRPITEKIRDSGRYKQWRQQIFIRDNFTCQKCGQIGGKLEVHHIKPFHKLIEEVKNYLPLLNLYDGAMLYTPLWNIDNGLTLCKKCHWKLKRK